MGMMDSTMGNSDMDSADRMQMLTQKEKDGTLSDMERDELMQMRKGKSADSGM